MEVYRNVIDQFGTIHQLNMVVEEMSELTKEICKVKRGKGSLNDIISEIADVKITLEQLIIIIGEIECFQHLGFLVNKDEVESLIEKEKTRKILRLEKLLATMKND